MDATDSLPGGNHGDNRIISLVIAIRLLNVKQATGGEFNTELFD